MRPQGMGAGGWLNLAGPTMKGVATFAECIVRSVAERWARAGSGEPELGEEVGRRAAGMRVMKGKRGASTSTAYLSATGIGRFVNDVLDLVELSQEDPFAGPADPSLLCDPSAQADLALYDPAAGGFRLVVSTGLTAGYSGSYQSLGVVPEADDEGGNERRGYHATAKRFLADLDDPKVVGEWAARRNLRKLGAKSLPTCEVPVVFDPAPARSKLGLLAGWVMGTAESYLLGREGSLVASDRVTIVDAHSSPQAPGSRAVAMVSSRRTRGSGPPSASGPASDME